VDHLAFWLREQLFGICLTPRSWGITKFEKTSIVT